MRAHFLRFLRSLNSKNFWQPLQHLIIVYVAYFAFTYSIHPFKTLPAAATLLNLAILLLNTSILVSIFITIKNKLISNTFLKSKRDNFYWFLALFSGLVAISCQTEYFIMRILRREMSFLGEIRQVKESTLIALILCQFFLSVMIKNPIQPLVKEAQQRSRLSSIQKLIPILIGYMFIVSSPTIMLYLANSEAFFPGDSLKFFSILLSVPVIAIIIGISFTLRHCTPTWAFLLFLSLLAAHYHSPMLNAAIKNSPDHSIWLHLLPIFALSLFMFTLSKIDPKLFISVASLYFLSSLVPSTLGSKLYGLAKTTANPDPDNQGVPGTLDNLDLSKVKDRPNVFFLVYDGYPNPNLMKKYGFDFSHQLNLLQDLGFQLYPDAYTLYPATLGSIGRVMNMSGDPKIGIAGPNEVLKTFKRLGYESRLVLSSYFFQSTPKIAADYIYPHREPSQLKILILGFATGIFKSEYVFDEYSRGEWLAAKREAIAARKDRPFFLYSHSAYPGHTQNSGRCLENEKKIIRERIEIANQEMAEDLKIILEEQKDSIIIVASDHGPYLTGDCYLLNDRSQDAITSIDLQDRYGVLLAIRWPNRKKPEQLPPKILQDTFFDVFSYITANPDLIQMRLTRQASGISATLTEGAIQDGVIKIGRDIGHKLF